MRVCFAMSVSWRHWGLGPLVLIDPKRVSFHLYAGPLALWLEIETC